MKDRYTKQRDIAGEWISAPIIGNDLGDMEEIVEELNMLYNKNKAYAKIIESYEKELDKFKSHD